MKRRGGWLLPFLLLVGGMIVDVPPAKAHPHVFVDYGVVLLFGADGLTGVQVSWTFDEMFSSMLVDSTKGNPGGALSPAEIKAIEQRHFQPLFLGIRVDGKLLRIDSVRDFRVNLAADRVTYTFVVPISSRNAGDGTLEIRVDDPAYYIAFDPRAESPVRWNAPPAYAVNCRVIPSSGRFESASIQCVYRRKSP